MAYGYIIVDMQITDMEQYKLYMASAPESVAQAGGEYLARGGTLDVMEGDWKPGRMALLRFPSFAAAQDWYHGEMYARARAERAGATKFFNMVLLEGVAAPV
jgi:uncharacterized protein (DUF1330 family)